MTNKYTIVAGKNITIDQIIVPDYVKSFEFINNPYMEDNKAILIDNEEI